MKDFNLSTIRQEMRQYDQENKMATVLITLDEIQKQDREFIRRLKGVFLRHRTDDFIDEIEGDDLI